MNRISRVSRKLRKREERGEGHLRVMWEYCEKREERWEVHLRVMWEYCEKREGRWEVHLRVMWEKRRKRGSLCYSHESWKRGWGKNHVRKSVAQSVVWLSQSHLIIRGTIRVSVLSKCQSRVIWIIDKHNISAHWDCDHTTTWQYCLRILTWSSVSQLIMNRISLIFSEPCVHVRERVSHSLVWLSQSHLIIRGTIRVAVLWKCQSCVKWKIHNHKFF